ncbi:TRAP transporter substrate-binding protein [Kushneria marisflavi]|uniref:C4-dicarboxylate ABC transporter substrate-binding protein n=1 Tax=Kushneria marisflavi TaxID=157779 RepID=A0A240UQ96_9GAMM|nr:TRAP transporter substrate-binding protein [Kushneria marisflavi]ART63658.1 C4-dicarboxylate ABC transporter substrate-binding protein [Kushneria marisflavi]RKD85331.1 TRAP-type C4-dicarboxylate transport system substrate-binding protein [Kushneria marisflavi]
MIQSRQPRTRSHLSAVLLATTIGAGVTTTASADTSLNVVGSWGSLELHQKFEQPFWSETLPKASNGEITTQVTSFDQMGIASGDVFRYLGDGLFDVGMTVGDYTVSDAPELEGLDLPMMTTESEDARAVAEAFRPIAENALNQRFNSHVLAIVPYPAQVLFCNTPISGLADLEGKKVRGSGRSTGEFLEALGAQSLNIAFNEVPGSLERGVIDCAVTGSMSGYSAGWYDVSSHVLPLPIGGWDYVITAINQDKWQSLDADEQELIQKQIDEQFTMPVWANAKSETQRGIACLTGQGECPAGEAAGMTLVEPTEADTERARQALKDVVLPAWAKRVDADTIRQWNESVGQVVDLKADAP